MRFFLVLLCPKSSQSYSPPEEPRKASLTPQLEVRHSVGTLTSVFPLTLTKLPLSEDYSYVVDK